MLSSSSLNFAGLVNQLLSVINAALPVLAGVALLAFFWGLTKYIYASGDARGHTQGKELILGGLLALFVLFSLWGIINLASVALFGSAPNNHSTSAPSTQTPVQTYAI